MARFQETLRRLAMIDEASSKTRPGSGSAWPGHRPLILRPRRCFTVAASVAAGSVGGLRWMDRRPCAGGGATEDEIADVLLAIAPVAGSAGRLRRSRCAAALGSDIAAALGGTDSR